jgi:uncharacterized protein YjbI with pentapeptide repeats
MAGSIRVLGAYTTTLRTDEGTTSTEVHPAKTLWDWMDLLVMPIVLAVGVWLLNHAERASEQKIARQRIEEDRKIAEDRVKETTLQNYLDRMAALLLEHQLKETEGKEDAVSLAIRDVAQVRTVTTLRTLDRERRNIVIQFLRDAKLAKFILSRVNLDGVDLSGAHLSGVNLSGTHLKKANMSGAYLNSANLSEADLREADLRRAILYWAKLSYAKLDKANLSRAILISADLDNVKMSGANLEGADLSGVDLNGADLSGANLHSADLEGANLSCANLSMTNFHDAYLFHASLHNTNVTDEQLVIVKSLEETIMQDGSKHD